MAEARARAAVCAAGRRERNALDYGDEIGAEA